MSDLRDLYQEVILDHSKHPRNFGEPGSFTCKADGHNPLCGDRLTVFLTVEDGIVKDLSFKGTGCAISTAAASMMSETLEGKTLEEARQVFSKFHEMLTGDGDVPPEDLGKLAVFSGVREFPIRVKCATLAWHTLRAALNADTETVTTEDGSLP
ncbi:MAG: SUF system NifU family Fe-S cluster assembly protein [Acidobacteriota bacterium]|nr:SUF system NifU family Fe-S cluster assembly protein [Acidobacteriota bacterium]